MANIAKVTAMGKQSGIPLSKETLERLHLQRGDIVYLMETPNGVHVTPCLLDSAEAMPPRTPRQL